MELADEDFYKVFFQDVEIGDFDEEALRFRARSGHAMNVS
jgi:hypothetical protein